MAKRLEIDDLFNMPYFPTAIMGVRERQRVINGGVRIIISYDAGDILSVCNTNQLICYAYYIMGSYPNRFAKRQGGKTTTFFLHGWDKKGEFRVFSVSVSGVNYQDDISECRVEIETNLEEIITLRDMPPLPALNILNSGLN